MNNNHELIASPSVRQNILLVQEAGKLLHEPEVHKLVVLTMSSIVSSTPGDASDCLKVISRNSCRCLTRGLSDALPPVMYCGVGRTRRCGQETHLGRSLYKHKTTGIFYVLCTASSQDGHLVNFILRTEVTQLSKKNNIESAPILHNNILEEVVQHTIGILKRKKQLKEHGVKATYGILLNGPAGNGKTMLCRYIKSLAIYEHGITCLNRTASDIDHAFQKNTLGDLFNAQYDDTVHFFDDVDISYLNRTSGNGKVACSILSALDGVDMHKQYGSIRIFTTNEDTSSMDEAFIRPGRIDKIITLNPPDTAMRLQLVSQWANRGKLLCSAKLHKDFACNAPHNSGGLGPRLCPKVQVRKTQQTRLWHGFCCRTG
jgi:hypothetical protein